MRHGLNCCNDRRGTTIVGNEVRWLIAMEEGVV